MGDVTWETIRGTLEPTGINLDAIRADWADDGLLVGGNQLWSCFADFVMPTGQTPKAGQESWRTVQELKSGDSGILSGTDNKRDLPAVCADQLCNMPLAAVPGPPTAIS